MKYFIVGSHLGLKVFVGIRVIGLKKVLLILYSSRSLFFQLVAPLAYCFMRCDAPLAL